MIKSTKPVGYQFAMIPMAIASDRDLSAGAKVLFAVILSLTKGLWGQCRASNERLAEMSGLSVIQVRRLFQVLEKRGLISRVIRGRHRFEIKVTWEVKPRVQGSYEEYLASEWWKERQAKTLKLDRYRCRLCNSPDSLNVHHRTYDRLGAELDSDLISLCRDCHAKFHDKLVN